MGIRSVLKDDPEKVVREYCADPAEDARRQLQKKRYDLLFDNVEESVCAVIDLAHNDPDVKLRMRKFAGFAAAQAPFKRTVRETSRPVYCVAAVRKIEPKDQQKRWSEMADEVRLNGVMDAALLRMNAANHVFVLFRYVDRKDKVIATVIPAHRMDVIPDPDDPCTALAYMYHKPVYNRAKHQWVTHRVLWDDEITWEFDEDLRPIGNAEKNPHPNGEIPIVAIHKNEIRDTYWDLTDGNDLVAADDQAKLMEIWKLRKLKAQGFGQLVAEQSGAGSSSNFPSGQTLDPENILQGGGGVTLKNIAGDTGVENFLAAEEAVVATAAANRGVSKSRLNQDTSEGQDDTGLNEQRADMMKIMRGAEHGAFRVMQVVSRSYKKPERRLSEEAKLAFLNFGEIQARVDRLKQLETRKLERSMGLRSWLDDRIEDQPELQGDKTKAEETGMETMKEEARFVEERRALNIPEDATVDEAGQDAKANGAMGPAVRDGNMKRDDAAEQAKRGPKAA